MNHPDYIQGILDFLNCIHWKRPADIEFISMNCGQASDTAIANGYNYAFEWNDKDEDYKAVKL